MNDFREDRHSTDINTPLETGVHDKYSDNGAVCFPKFVAINIVLVFWSKF